MAGRKKNPDRYEKSFPKNLRKYLDEHPKTGKKTSQKELADYIGVKRQTVSEYANGNTSPDWEIILKIADFFGVTTDMLLADKDGITAEQEIDNVSHYIGLSRETVDFLHNVKSIGGVSDTLNAVLSNSKLVMALTTWFCSFALEGIDLSPFCDPHFFPQNKNDIKPDVEEKENIAYANILQLLPKIQESFIQDNKCNDALIDEIRYVFVKRYLKWFCIDNEMLEEQSFVDLLHWKLAEDSKELAVSSKVLESYEATRVDNNHSYSVEFGSDGSVLVDETLIYEQQKSAILKIVKRFLAERGEVDGDQAEDSTEKGNNI